MAGELVKADGLGIQQLISEGLKNNASIDVMERLFALSKESMAIKAKQEFYFALSKFQKEIPKIIKNKPIKNKSGNVVYHYAPLEEIVEQVKTSLESNGFSYTLKTKQENNSITVFCEAHHVSGYTDTTDITVPIGSDYMSAQQQVGAALTFAKRYAFCDAFGIMTGDEDTDAVATEEPKKEQPKATQSKQETPPVKVPFKDLPVEQRLSWAIKKSGELGLKINMADLEILPKEEQYQTIVKAVNDKKKADETKKEAVN